MSAAVLVAVDLFAGTGWGVACRALGIPEHGVELMPEAIATREANGMHTAFHDVWDGLEGAAEVPTHELLIASPPCQTFSMAGGGKGRQALDEVLKLIDERAYLRTADLRAFGEHHDPRTALVLTPLAYVARHAPTYVVLEQVPPVLPVWERMAEELERWGYSTWTGVLSAEQYGVPQTRKRAILIARADGKVAKPPTPTHSRYYPTDKTKLDPDVLPWVSMAEALGWAEPVVMRSNYGTGGDPAARGERTTDQPAPTMTSKADRNLWRFAGAGSTAVTTSGQVPRIPEHPAHTVTGAQSAAWVDESGAHVRRVTLEEAALLQSYPAGFRFMGTKTKQFLQVGNAVPPLLAHAILKEVIS